MAARDTLAVLAEELAFALDPLVAAIETSDGYRDFLEDFGWDFDTVPAPLDNLRTAVQAAAAFVADGPVADADIPQLLAAVADVYAAIADLALSPDLPDDFKGEFPRQLVDYLLVEHLLGNWPRWGYLLQALGVIRLEDVPAQGARLDFDRRVFDFQAIEALFANPLGHLKTSYRWGQSDFDGLRLVDSLASLFAAWDFTIRDRHLDPGTSASLNAGAIAPATTSDLTTQLVFIEHTLEPELFGAGVGLSLLPETAGDKPGFALLPFTTSEIAEEINIAERLHLGFAGSVELTGQLGLFVRPDKQVQFVGGLGSGAPTSVTGSLGVALRLDASDDPVIVLGTPEGSRFQFDGLVTGAGTRFDSAGSLDVFTELALQQAKIVISPAAGEPDSFLGKLLPDDGFEVAFDLAIGFSTARGMYFRGSGGFEIDLPAALQVGPVEVVSASLAVRFGDEGLPVDLTATVRGDLGVLKATVQKVGLTALFTFPAGRKGNLGPANLALQFKGPSGVGLAIEAGPVAGAGFLFFDPDQRRYGGALTLRIYEIEVSAFGIIETVLPGGQPGFSFAILISARFTPIPIGLGFTLNGVGGLLGINRTVDTQALQDTVRTHTLDNVLFPEAPENNALEILGSLRALFPAAEGRFAFGPMAIIGWGGTIPVLEAEIGLILELPEPIRLTILGQVRAGLPDKDKAFVKLNFDAVGVLDFERKTFSLDASLYESNVGGFPISGDMALRLNWGSPPNFVLSIGGFHPQFQPPPGIPALARVQVALGQNGNPRITIQGYLAITSNTAQIGARAEVLAFKGSFSLLGWIGFDALFTFQPFTFKADFSAGVALRKGSRHIASIRLHGTLTGPNPWHVSGEACLSLWFFDICIGFSVPLSDRKPEALQPAPAIAPRLRDALADLRNWSAELPAGAHQAVSLRVSPEARPAVLVDPLGGLSVRQRVVPLDVRITRFENVKLAKNAQPRFTIGAVTLGAGAGSSSASVGKVSDFFARAQFEDMSDAKKLSLPAFEALTSGVSVQSAALDTRGRVDCEVTYETSVLDAPDAADEPGSSYIPLGSRLDKLARLSGSGLGGLRAVGPDQFGSRFTVLRTDLSPEPFTVAGVGGLVARPELVADVKQRLGFVSKANAQRILEQHLENNPADRGTLQVVPELELPRAA